MFGWQAMTGWKGKRGKKKSVPLFGNLEKRELNVLFPLKVSLVYSPQNWGGMMGKEEN